MFASDFRKMGDLGETEALVQTHALVIGQRNPRNEDVPVNAARAKQLTNFRSQGEGKGIQLAPPIKLSLERAIEYIGPDEYVEATPKSLRLRKKILSQTERRKMERNEKKAAE